MHFNFFNFFYIESRKTNYYSYKNSKPIGFRKNPIHRLFLYEFDFFVPMYKQNLRKATQKSLRLLFGLRTVDEVVTPVFPRTRKTWCQSTQLWYQTYGRHFYLLRSAADVKQFSNFSSSGLFTRFIHNEYSRTFTKADFYDFKTSKSRVRLETLIKTIWSQSDREDDDGVDSKAKDSEAVGINKPVKMYPLKYFIDSYNPISPLCDSTMFVTASPWGRFYEYDMQNVYYQKKPCFSSLQSDIGTYLASRIATHELTCNSTIFDARFQLSSWAFRKIFWLRRGNVDFFAFTYTLKQKLYTGRTFKRLFFSAFKLYAGGTQQSCSGSVRYSKLLWAKVVFTLDFRLRILNNYSFYGNFFMRMVSAKASKYFFLNVLREYICLRRAKMDLYSFTHTTAAALYFYKPKLTAWRHWKKTFFYGKRKIYNFFYRTTTFRTQFFFYKNFSLRVFKVFSSSFFLQNILNVFDRTLRYFEFAENFFEKLVLVSSFFFFWIGHFKRLRVHFCVPPLLYHVLALRGFRPQFNENRTRFYSRYWDFWRKVKRLKKKDELLFSNVFVRIALNLPGIFTAPNILKIPLVANLFIRSLLIKYSSVFSLPNIAQTGRFKSISHKFRSNLSVYFQKPVVVLYFVFRSNFVHNFFSCTLFLPLHQQFAALNAISNRIKSTTNGIATAQLSNINVAAVLRLFFLSYYSNNKTFREVDYTSQFSITSTRGSFTSNLFYSYRFLYNDLNSYFKVLAAKFRYLPVDFAYQTEIFNTFTSDYTQPKVRYSYLLSRLNYSGAAIKITNVHAVNQLNHSNTGVLKFIGRVGAGDYSQFFNMHTWMDSSRELSFTKHALINSRVALVTKQPFDYLFFDELSKTLFKTETQAYEIGAFQLTGSPTTFEYLPSLFFTEHWKKLSFFNLFDFKLIDQVKPAYADIFNNSQITNVPSLFYFRVLKNDVEADLKQNLRYTKTFASASDGVVTRTVLIDFVKHKQAEMNLLKIQMRAELLRT